MRKRGQRLSRAECWAIALLALAGCASTFAVHRAAVHSEQAAARDRLSEIAAEAKAGLDRRIERVVSALYASAALFYAGDAVTRRQFETFVEVHGPRLPEIERFQWQPRVPSARRERFEREAREQGLAGFRLLERDAAGAPRPARARSEHFPIYYEAPYRAGTTAVGLDLAGDAVLAAPQRAAAATATVVTSPVVPLLRATDDGGAASRPVVRVSLPVYATLDPPHPGARRDAVRGFVSVVLRVESLLDAAFAPLGAQPVDLSVADVSGLSPVSMYRRPPGPGAAIHPDIPTARIALPVPGRSWTLTVTPRPGFGGATGVPLSSSIAFAGVLLTALLCAYVYDSRRTRAHVLDANDALRLAQERLEEVLELNRKIVEQAPFGILAYRAQGACVLANEAAAKAVGATVDALLRQDFRRIHSWRDSGLRDAALGALAEQRPVHLRSSFTSTFGRKVWLDCELIPFASGGEPHLMMIANDITQQLAAERELRDAHAMFRSLAEEAGVGVYIIQDEHFRYVNPRLAQMFGYRQDEVAGAIRPEDLVAPASSESVRETIRRRLLGDYPTVHFEFTGRRADGAEIAVEVYGSRSTYGDRPALIGTLLDVTERKRAEERIRHAKLLLQGVVDSTPDWIYAKDADHRFLLVNRAFAQAVGRSPAALVGLPDTAVLPQSLCLGDSARAIRGLHDDDREVLAGRALHLDHDPIALDGVARVFDTYKAPLHTGAGEVAGVLVFRRDVSDRVRTERERLALESQLRQAQKMESIGHLTGGIAHDFNNILAAILGYTELAQMLAFAPDTKLPVYLDEIHLAAGRGRDLVSQLLAFSRSEDSVAADAVRVEPVVKEAVKLLRSTLPSTVAIELRLGENLPGVHITPVQLHQLLMNLSINARDAMGGKGLIGISVDVRRMDELVVCASCHQHFSGRYVAIRVSDQGCGVGAADLERIFDPFFTTKAVGKGTGLGLSVVHGIVHAAGGHIRVRSAPGSGSVFMIMLPAVVGEWPALRAPAVEDAARPARGRVLVVDDEPAIVGFTTELLQAMGCAAKGVADPVEALALFRADPLAFDLVVTDQTMPALSGIELSRELLALRPGLPVILCTGYSAAVDEAAARAAGVRRFLLKPTGAPALSRAIADVLGEAASVTYRAY